MSNYRVINADVTAGMATLPDQSIQTCITSPPYFGLRDYGTGIWTGGDVECDHKKTTLYGAASTLRSDGRQHTGPYETEKGATHSVTPYRDQCGKCGAERTDNQIGLEATPDAYVTRLVEIFRDVRRVLNNTGTLWLNLGDSYANDGKWGGHTGGKHAKALHCSPIGRNKKYTGLKPKDLIGIPWRVAFALQADGWYLRQDIIWSKPNPMPESVLDRCTKAHEYVFLLSKQKRYYYDAKAIQETAIGGTPGNKTHKGKTAYVGGDVRHRTKGGLTKLEASEFRNKRSVWTVASEPYPEAHFATFPTKLVEPCVLAGCPEGGTVLDPFMGSGTTLAVALNHERNAIGIELNPAYCELARTRIQRRNPMFTSEIA